MSGKKLRQQQPSHGKRERYIQPSILMGLDDKSSYGYEEWPFDKRFHLIMNIAIGGSWGGLQGIDNSIFPVQMEVEYVRVYKKDS